MDEKPCVRNPPNVQMNCSGAKKKADVLRRPNLPISGSNSCSMPYILTYSKLIKTLQTTSPENNTEKNFNDPRLLEYVVSC